MINLIALTICSLDIGEPASIRALEDRPRMDSVERAFLLKNPPTLQDTLGLALQEVVQPGSEATDVLAAWTLDSQHWMRRVFRQDALPEPSRIAWSGTVLRTHMGTWEHVNAVLRLGGRRAWWADGFTSEDPRAVNPFWLWLELDGSEIDTSSREAVEVTVAEFVGRLVNKYDETLPIQTKVYRDATVDRHGYWELTLMQDVPDRVPSPFGWMKSMGIETNGRHFFMTVLYCTDSTFNWRKGTEYFPAANAGYRSRSRFTGELLKYHQALTNPKYSEIGGGG